MAEPWTQVKLAEIAQFLSGGTPRKSQKDLWNGSIPWISGASLDTERLVRSDRQVSDEAIGNGTRLAPEGSTLVLVRGMSLLDEIRVGIATRPLAFNQDVKALVPQARRADALFLFYAVLARRRHLLSQVHQAGHGTGVLATARLMELTIPLPPLEEQRRIAGVLGALDDLAAECERLASACVALADSLWQRLQADATRSCAFGEIAALSRTRVASDAAADLPFIGLEHLREAGGGLMGSGRLSDVSSGAVAFEGGDVLYGKLRPYFRKFARPGFAGGASPEIWVLSPKGSATHSLLHAVVSSPRFTDHAMAGAGGTRMPRASWSHVADFRLSLPDDEQAKSVERVASALWEAHWQLADEMVQARTTRDELLPLLLSGRVRVGEVAA